MRIAHLNVGRFPLSPDDPKQSEFFDWVRSIQADLVGVSEVGLKWNKMKEKETWADRVRGQFRSEQSKWARNKNLYQALRYA